MNVVSKILLSHQKYKKKLYFYTGGQVRHAEQELCQVRIIVYFQTLLVFYKYLRQLILCVPELSDVVLKLVVYILFATRYFLQSPSNFVVQFVQLSLHNDKPPF